MENFETPGLTENEKDQLGQQYRDQNLPVDLENKTVLELRKRGFFKASFFSPYPYLRPAFFILLISVVFVSGFYFGNKKRAITVSNNDAYLFLLHNPPGFVESNSHVKEYGEWFGKMTDETAAGEELKDKGWTVALQNNTPFIQPNPVGGAKVSGYFIVHAPSEKAALDMAVSCPHIKYNGVVEVRPIQVNN